jgi:predicted DNA-binding antitoxin AbrB/MazE fold protein
LVKRQLTREIEAVYENGILRPLAPLSLAEHQHVKVTVSELPGDSLAAMIDETFLEYARKEVAAADNIPTLEEVRRMAAKDPGSWAEAIIAEGVERFSCCRFPAFIRSPGVL